MRRSAVLITTIASVALPQAAQAAIRALAPEGRVLSQQQARTEPAAKPGPAAAPKVSGKKKAALAEKLVSLRDQVIVVEKDLLKSLKSQSAVNDNLKKIKFLLKLQKQERELGQARLDELENTIAELETRRGVLRERVLVHQHSIRQFLIDIARSERQEPQGLQLPAREKIEAPRRKVLSRLVDRSLKEIEALRIDLADADQLEQRIQEERHQLAYLFQDLREQESILELNRQLQADLLRRKHDERVAQLERYRKLKNAEAQVERLISNFNARLELERTVETERIATKAMMQGFFPRMKGKLPLPVQGEVVSAFGKAFDPDTKLNVFRKGIDIAAGNAQQVRAISAGKVAYSGELPNYGRITIIDHGEHYYSLVAHLGELYREAGDAVAAGDPIGVTDETGTPVYFEIRARNVAVNPLQWVSN